MKSLFDTDEPPQYAATQVSPRTSDWRPQEPPTLNGVREVYLNFEATGLKWWKGDRPIGVTVGYGDRACYLPWGHLRGGNLDEATVKRWAERELRGKRITNINTRFDVHMSRVWGVDLEAQGNEVSDVGHYAALLDDHRLKFNLDQLIFDYLYEQPMPRLDESRMQFYHAGEAAPRAEYNVHAVRRLKHALWPLLDAEDLQPVRALEDRVIFVVCEMEKNGAPIDLELLDRWIVASQERFEALLRDITREVGFPCNPTSPIHLERVFQKFGLPIERTGTGRPSFTDAILKDIDHPVVALLRRARRLASLRSKFLVNTRDMVGSDGILRYSLHQLRAAKDDNDEFGAGTVTGRFSSSAPAPNEGVNIQQRMKAARQRVAFGYDEHDTSHDDEIFLVRKLHIAGSGMVLSSDMDQAQYRIFAHYVNNPRVIQAYREHSDLSFHQFMYDLVKPYAELTYRQQKDLNFAYIFGAGLTKMALMLGHITVAEYDSLKGRRGAWDNPKLARTREVKRIYEQELPEVAQLLALAGHLAKPKCDESCRILDGLHRAHKHQGFVRTFLGRRSRFPLGHRLHKAFNSVDQGTEADYMKTKLVELHEARKETQLTLRITNHDEVVGDIPDWEHAKRVDTLLNRQSFDLRVPLTWSTGVGLNWASCKEIKDGEYEDIEAVREALGDTNGSNTGREHR